VRLLPCAAIRASPLNPRRRFTEPALIELMETMAEHSLIEPIVVRALGPEEYELVAGARRLAAAERLGWPQIPAIVREVKSEEELLQLMLVENLQRQELDPIEEARAYRALNERGLSQSAIARRVGCSQPRIANAMRLLSLPERVQEWIAEGQLTASHGRAIARFAARPDIAARIAEEAIRRRGGTKELERGVPFHDLLVAEGLLPPPPPPEAPPPVPDADVPQRAPALTEEAPVTPEAPVPADETAENEPAEPPLSYAEARALLRRLPHRAQPLPLYLALVARAGWEVEDGAGDFLPGAERAGPDGGSSPWDAPAHEPAPDARPEIGPIPFEVGPRLPGLSAALFALFLLLSLVVWRLA
jgi:ParB/RepB/Spo0J family partition protein